MIVWSKETNTHRNLLSVMKESSGEGMQHFDGEIEKLVRAGTVDLETALKYASFPEELRAVLHRNSTSDLARTGNGTRVPLALPNKPHNKPTFWAGKLIFGQN